MIRFVFTALFAFLGTMAFAHSPLRATTPADGATVADVPSELTLNFNNKIRLTRLELGADDAASLALDISDKTSFETEFHVPLAPLDPGKYVVDWRGLGDDGHPQNGTFTFTVE